MKGEIDKRRTRFRENIRKNHLESKFRQIRHLMKDIVHEDIRQQIRKHLAVLGKNFSKKESGFEMVECITELRKISEEYNLVVLFCHLAQNEDITWLDVLCNIMREEWAQALHEQVSFLLLNCIEPLRQIVHSSNPEKIYCEQMNRIIQQYPYEQIKEGTPKTIQNTLKIIYFLILSNESSKNLYYLLNKTTPPLLKMLLSLNNNQLMMTIIGVREEYIKTCLSIASLAFYYRLQTHQNEYYQRLKQTVSSLVEERLYLSGSKEEFSTYCEHVRIMVNIDFYVVTSQRLQKFEQYLERQLREENMVYIKMLHTIFYNSKEILSAKSVRKIIECIFDVGCYGDYERVNFRLSLLKLIKYQTINSSNRFRDEDGRAFVEQWGSQDAEYLLEFADAIKSFVPTKLSLLFEIIGSILTWTDKPMDLMETSLLPLLKYPQYRIMLQYQGYELLGQEDDL